MENNEKKNVEIVPTKVEEVEKKPSFVVRAGRWIWSKKWYLVTGLASFAAGALLTNGRDDVDDYCEEQEDIGPEE